MSISTVDPQSFFAPPGGGGSRGIPVPLEELGGLLMPETFA